MQLNLHLSLHAILLSEAGKLIACCNNFYLYTLHLPSWHTSTVSAAALQLVEYATRLTFNHWGCNGWYTLYLPVRRDGGLPDIIGRALSSLLLVFWSELLPCLRKGGSIWSSLASVSLTPSTMFLDYWCLFLWTCRDFLLDCCWSDSSRLALEPKLDSLRPSLSIATRAAFIDRTQ